MRIFGLCAPYGVGGEDHPDPVSRTLSGLLDEETPLLRARVSELEAEKSAPKGSAPPIGADEAESERLS